MLELRFHFYLVQTVDAITCERGWTRSVFLTRTSARSPTRTQIPTRTRIPDLFAGRPETCIGCI